MTLELGPFALERLIGHGGMGEVWRGVHRAHGVTVAVKVITSRLDNHADYGEAFEREVQAQAAMDHSGILRVFDYGTIPAALERQSQGQLLAQSPYLVMEYADAGSLAQHPLSSWAQLFEVIKATLEALAHAHARRLVHLDLKPANVLCARHEGALHYKLGDFGIAFATESKNARSGKLRESTMMGTPAYMAPEQILGQWRAFGPWTDLYALGCMVWELLHDKTPFEAPSILGLAMAHLQNPPGDYSPRFEVPGGLEGWLFRLLQKAPHLRFDSAAGALYALEQIHRDYKPHAPTAEAQLRPRLEPLEELSQETLQLDHRSDALSETLDSQAAILGLSRHDLMSSDHPWQRYPPRQRALKDLVPPAPHWREEPPAKDAALAGVGLGLWGLKEWPMVGRRKERDALWGALYEVISRGGVGHVMLNGAQGQGKSALVRWLSRQADEQGVAQVVAASYAAQPGPLDGLRGMLTLGLRLVELEREQVFAHIYEHTRAWFPIEAKDRLEDMSAALTAWVAPQDMEEDWDHASELPRVRFSSERERYFTLCQYLAQRAQHKPLLVCIEGLTHSLQAVEFVQYALNELAPYPVLFVTTMCREQLSAGGWIEEAAERLIGHEATQLVELSALKPDEHHELITRLLAFEPTQAKQIEALTAGQPLFAVQLIQDWVERGLLRSTLSGFELSCPIESLALPSSVAALCQMRLSNLIARQSVGEDQAWCALELAAALGQEFSAQEWQQVCAQARIMAQPALLSAMVIQGIARRTERGWAFENQLFVKALEEHARSAERWQLHHLRAARMIMAEQQGPRSSQRLERAVTHYLHARELERGFELLWDVLPMLDSGSAQQLLLRAEEALAASPSGTRAMALQLGFMGWVPWFMHTGQLESARSSYDKLMSHELEPELEVEALLIGAQLSLYERDYPSAEALSARALRALASQPGQEALTAKGLKLQAESAHFGGELERALPLFERALEIYERLNLYAKRAWVQYGLASCLVDLGQYERADAQLKECEAAMVQLGDRAGECYAQTVMAVLRYDRGEYREALEAFYKAQKAQEAMGDGGVWLTRENYARCLIKLGQYEQALPIFRGIERQRQRQAQGIFINYVGDAILSCYAGLGDWDSWRAFYDEAMLQLERSAQRDEILVEALEETLRLVLARGERALARPLFEVIEALCVELELEERCARLHALWDA